MISHGRITLIDTTLRDGEQTPGLSFSTEQKLLLATSLEAAGIDEIEGGSPMMSSAEEASFSCLNDAVGSIPVVAWSRMQRTDIEACHRAGARYIHLSLPSSDLMLAEKLGHDRQWALRQTAQLVALCRDLGMEVSLGAEDASRSDRSFLVDLFNFAAEQGARRVRYADTLGCLTPTMTKTIISHLVEQISLPLEFHGHNDFGLATANSLCALEAGASALSATLCGLGERAGNASLEELAASLSFLYGRESTLDLGSMVRLCQMAAEFSGRAIPAQKPVVGDLVFTHESGIHVDGLLKNPELYSFLDPAILGRTNQIVPGKHSGRRALAHCARVLGYQPDQTGLEKIRNELSLAQGPKAPAEAWAFFHTLLEHHTGAERHGP